MSYVTYNYGSYNKGNSCIYYVADVALESEYCEVYKLQSYYLVLHFLTEMAATQDSTASKYNFFLV